MKRSNVTLLMLAIVAIYGNPTGAGGADAGPLVLVYTVRNSTDYQPSLGPHGTEPMVRLEISRARHRLTVYHGAVPIKQYPVAVGRAGWETPVGDFRVFQMFEDPDWKHPLTGRVFPAGDERNELGHYWIGFWTNGETCIGLHGTPHPETVGKSASHGCVRMYQKDVEQLFSQLAIGTPVSVR